MGNLAPRADTGERVPSAGPWDPWPLCPEIHQDLKPAGAWPGTPCLTDKKGVFQSRENNLTLIVHPPPPPKYMSLLKATQDADFPLAGSFSLFSAALRGSRQIPQNPWTLCTGALNLPGGLADNSGQSSCCLLSFRGNALVLGR